VFRPLWSICLGWFFPDGLISRMRSKQRGRQKRTNEDAFYESEAYDIRLGIDGIDGGCGVRPL
jgi:hypothetical protein